jgi:protein-histidine pros-kinase
MFTRFKDLSMSKKLMRMSMIVSAFVLLVAYTAFLGYEWVTFEKNAVERLSSNAEIVGIDVTPTLLFNDPTAATESLRALRAIPNITDAGLYGSDGKQFATYVRGSQNAATGLPKRLELTSGTHRIDNHHLMLLKPIVSDGKPIGMIYIQSDLKEIEQRLRGYAVIVFAVLVASFAVALVVSSLLQRKISGPILTLAETARVIAARRDYSVRAAVESKDETGVLGQAFNDMLREIEEQNNTLKESERSFRESDAALRRSEARKAAILQSALDSIITIDDRGRVVDFNPAAEQTFGYQHSEVVGRLLAELIIPPDLRQAHVAGLARYSQTGEHVVLNRRIELRAMRSNGSEFPAELAITPILGQDKPMFTGYLRDISDRKRAEQEMLQLNAELEGRVRERTEKLTAANQELARANEAKDRFLATMSHELRTPLNAIIGFTGTLLMKLPGPLTADQENQLQTVRSSARHLLSLINDLLDLAKIESGKVELKFEPVSRQSVVNEVAMALAPLAEAKGLRFEVVLPEEDVVVPADTRALSQIVINLANNAIKFTDKGFIRVELKKLDTARPRVELSVIDSGIGITEEDQKKLFRAFERAQGKRQFEGTGLGLYLSQKLAALLGGQIVCHSEYGNGSSFSLTL